MTTLAPEKRLTRVQATARVASFGLQTWAWARALLVPLALLWTEGVAFALGIGYALMYAGMMFTPTSLNLVLMYDALRVLLGRRATVLPWMIAEYVAGARWRFGGRTPKADPWVKLAVLGNPLTTLAGECRALAVRWRPEALARVNEDAQRFAERMRQARPPQTFVAEAHELSRQMFDDIFVRYWAFSVNARILSSLQSSDPVLSATFLYRREDVGA